jgi:hypothetical protein
LTSFLWSAVAIKKPRSDWRFRRHQRSDGVTAKAGGFGEISPLTELY